LFRVGALLTLKYFKLYHLRLRLLLDKDELDHGSQRLHHNGVDRNVLFTSPFKDHMEHPLLDAEIAQLMQGKPKFSHKVPVPGLQGGSWISSTSFLPKVDPFELLDQSNLPRIQTSPVDVSCDCLRELLHLVLTFASVRVTEFSQSAR
jgi:hypothetical protein